jgi:hypothetical protein
MHGKVKLITGTIVISQPLDWKILYKIWRITNDINYIKRPMVFLTSSIVSAAIALQASAPVFMTSIT